MASGRWATMSVNPKAEVYSALVQKIWQAYECYETNLEFNIRFMVDANVVGCNWLELPAGKYQVRKANRQSSCQVRSNSFPHGSSL